MLIPFAPVAIDTWPAAISGIIIGTKNGLTRRGPFSVKILNCSSYVSIPPIPEPIHTPIRGPFSSVISSFASATAIFAAATAYCVKRSIRRASFLSIYFSTSKSLISAATFAGNSSGSILVSRPIPDTPFLMFSHAVSTSVPTGVTAPSPVITTLFFSIQNTLLFFSQSLFTPTKSDCSPC
ncbi:hypothetical protein protein [Bacillus cereus G9241]|nr:hypothetical protein protein [Bacillus cereus G9241]